MCLGMNKICTKCGIEKPLSDFYKDKHNKSGYRGECIICLTLIHKNFRIKNKKKIWNSIKNYYAKFPWKKSLVDIKQRCINPNNKSYKDYGGRGIKCLITANELKDLWFRDKAYELKQPSINRKDNDGNYCIENCEYIELGLNSAEMNIRTKRKKVHQFDLEGSFIKEFISITEAYNETGVSISSISDVINNKRPFSKGFIWRYKEC